MEKLKRFLLDFISRNPKTNVSLLIIAATFLIMTLIFSSSPKISKRTPDIYTPVVHFIEAESGPINIPVNARGFLEPETEIQLSSKVSGTVIQITDKFAVGASFKKNDVLLKIDPAQLRMELHKAKANYEQTHLTELEINARLDAKASLKNKKNLSELAKGTPQRAVAKANTEAAMAALKLAQHQLDNATLRAPFNGKVMMRAIQQHELLSPGKPIAKIYSSNAYIVRLSLTEEQLAFIDLTHSENSNIDVTIKHPGSNTTWQGYVLRSEGYVSESRLIHLIVKLLLPDSNDTKSTLPLPGTLVEAEILGKPFAGVVIIPIKALKSRNTIWILDNNNRLKIKPVTVIHRSPDRAFIQVDLADSNKIITSHLPSTTEGMKLKPIADIAAIAKADTNDKSSNTEAEIPNDINTNINKTLDNQASPEDAGKQ